ncbi:MAG: hypothetical protein AB1847_06115 [bacterium]
MKHSLSQALPPASRTEQENYHLRLRFEYGPLDDGTLWIRIGVRGLFHADWMTLRLLLELNGGRSITALAEKYKIEQQELHALLVSLEKGGSIVSAGQGKITMGRQWDDIHLFWEGSSFLFFIDQGDGYAA